MDLQDIERDIRLLRKTNQELASMDDASDEIAEIIAENHQAIRVKVERRKQLQSALGLALDDDELSTSRVAGSGLKQSQVDEVTL